MEHSGTVAESLQPTFENITHEFITSTMHKILFSDKIPNFRFDFREREAMIFIEQVLSDDVEQYDWHKEKANEIMKSLKSNNLDNEQTPTLVVKEYKEFFGQLRAIYEKDIELYFKRTGSSGLAKYELENFLEQIWLRATPEDFNNAEDFLRKQAHMINDNTFEKYDSETCLGALKCLDNNVLCIKNEIARTWDETFQEMQITIYDKKYYKDKELFLRPNYILPVIRYGIYEKDGKKVCHIGSIQNKEVDEEKTEVYKKVEREKYKLNKEIDKEDADKVEPKKVMALGIFINLLNKEGITEIEAPGMRVLDYEYHLKRSKQLLEEFENEWTQPEQKRYERLYRRAYNGVKRNYGKEEIISEIKTERFVKTFQRMLCHYPKSEIISYPMEADSCLRMAIPKIKNRNEINNEMLKETYDLVEKQHTDIEI